jgi:MSHA biogenesis protein MshK
MRSRVLILLLAMPVLALAQPHAPLSDPTRPPAEFLSPQAAGSVPALPARPQLQSVLVGKGYEGREVAVIDGEIVKRGEKFRGAVLEHVGPEEAVLRRGEQKEVLHLYPLAAGSRKK